MLQVAFGVDVSKAGVKRGLEGSDSLVVFEVLRIARA